MTIIAWVAFVLIFLLIIDQTLFEGALIAFLFVVAIGVAILFGLCSLFAWAINRVTV